MATLTPVDPARLDEDRLAIFVAGFSGEVLRPEQSGYETARRVHNGLIDKRPALIARCRGTADIVDAVTFGRASGLEISIRGGGHNVAGRAVTEGGLMIDLSSMKGIHVDPAARTVRAQGGVTWGEFNRETAVHGLATTGGAVSTTGIAGLTLGGGLGWLMGKFGLAADNLLSVELVTAAGEVLNVSAEEHADLFWALRGGGGNFGVAASLEYRLHPLTTIYGGVVVHPYAAARDALRFYRDFAASTPDDLTVFAVLAFMPDEADPSFVFALCHAGSPEQAEADARPLIEYGTPTLVQLGTMPYPAINTLFDEGNPWGGLNYWKSNFMGALGDDAIEAIVNSFRSCSSPLASVVLEHFHGTVSRIDVSTTAVPHRGPGFNYVLASVWLDSQASDANVAWTRQTYAAVEPHFHDGRWVNYLGDDETTQRVRDAYGPHYARLVDVKRKYDPDNLFRLNHNIPTAG